MKFPFKECFDISVTISQRLPIYPGDTLIEITPLYSIKKGDTANILELKLGTHTGTHIDAPLHFLKDGKNLDEIELMEFCGPARVIELLVEEKIEQENLQSLELIEGEIILFKTKNSDLWDLPEFQKNFIYMSPEGAQFLVDKKVKAVGIDYLSIEKFRSKDHLTHRKLLEAGILILEGINLKNIQPGKYSGFLIGRKLKNLKT